MSVANEKTIFKQVLKKSILNKQKIDTYSKKVRDDRKNKKLLETRIVELMEDLGLNSLNFKHPVSGEKKSLVIDTKLKKKSLSKKVIKQNCLLYCNGDEEKASQIIDFLYDKNARDKVEKEQLKYNFTK